MEEIAATEAVGNLSTSPKPISLDEVSTDSAASVERGEQARANAESALSRILSQDMAANMETNFGEEVSGPGDRDVTAEKEQLVSAASRSEGGSTVDGNPAANTSTTNLVERVTAMYREVTVYHVGWSIANRMQKSVEQLLRGQ